MSVIWRPRPKLGGSMLWFRCDICHLSGDPWDFLEVFRGDEERRQLCAGCSAFSHTQADAMRADGWRWNEDS